MKSYRLFGWELKFARVVKSGIFLTDKAPMKNLILFFLLTLSSAFASYDNWQVTSLNDSKIWQHKTNPNITGTIQKLGRSTVLDWSKINKKTFYQSFEQNKKTGLSFLGVKNWKASSYKWETALEGEKLIIDGSYTDSAGLQVVFKEIHIFQNKNTLQILHTRPLELGQNKKLEEEFLTIAAQEVKSL